MKKYDSIVVGSGMSGMSMCLLLALNGHKVLLLEKASKIGGSISRFRRGKIPFDVGFHFTGGMHKDGILYDILKTMDMVDEIEPIFLPKDAACFIFEEEGKTYNLPHGFNESINRVKEYFPDDSKAVEKYFQMVKHVCDNTTSMDLSTGSFSHTQLDEDFVTLDEVLKELTSTPLLRGLLSGYAMCYGVKPSEVSFANHSRMCMNFYESLAYVKGGGDAFVDVFKKKLEEYDVDVCCGKQIVKMADIKNNRVETFVLSTGETVTAQNCVFTIHPHEILKVLPLEYFRKAFLERVRSFEPSMGFFGVFAALKEKADKSLSGYSPIVSLLPHHDVDLLLSPEYRGKPALVAIKSVEDPLEGNIKPFHILEPAFQEHTAEWGNSKTGKRPHEYTEFKKEKVESIMEHVLSFLPEYKGCLKVIDSGSMLTFRDYLNSPDGSAYGIKQKIGQFNLVGKLSLLNLHVAGQSAVLPGIIGAMMSSLIVGKLIVGKEQYEKFLSRHYAVK